MVTSRAPVFFISVLISCLATTTFVYAQKPGYKSFPRFEQFRITPDLYEPSGVVQLGDGRLVIAEDEAFHPLNLATLDTHGELQRIPIRYRPSLISLFRPEDLPGLGVIDDLEGLATGRDGFIYGVTSFSRTGGTGVSSRLREKLFRFRIDGERVTDPELVTDLKESLTANNRRLAKAATVKGSKKTGGLEIEGLTFDKSGNQLWLGFRSPLEDKNAIVMILENPSGIFSHEAPRFREISLDLDGGGIRGITYDPELQGYLILSRREDKKDKPFKLWYWTGEGNEAPLRVKVAGVKSLRRAEAITPVELESGKGILILSDEGGRNESRPGRYILLNYDQLTIERK